MRPGGDEQATPQRPVLDRGQMRPPLAPALLERPGRLDGGQLLTVRLALFEPCPSGRHVGVSHVQLLDVDEAGGREQASLIAPQGHRARERNPQPRGWLKTPTRGASVPESRMLAALDPDGGEALDTAT